MMMMGEGVFERSFARCELGEMSAGGAQHVCWGPGKGRGGGYVLWALGEEVVGMCGGDFVRLIVIVHSQLEKGGEGGCMTMIVRKQGVARRSHFGR